MTGTVAALGLHTHPVSDFVVVFFDAPNPNKKRRRRPHVLRPFADTILVVYIPSNRQIKQIYSISTALIESTFGWGEINVSFKLYGFLACSHFDCHLLVNFVSNETKGIGHFSAWSHLNILILKCILF